MIRFFVSGNSVRRTDYELPQVFLIPDNWNDWWRFQTLYGVVYIDQEGRRSHVGAIKIGELNMSSSRPNLPDVFTQLPNNFFSLGQDVDYYENTKDYGDEIRENFHTALNDIAFSEQLFEIAKEETVTTNSLMRSVSQKSIQGQFRRLALGEAVLTEYQFQYTSPRTRGISSVTLGFRVVPRSNPPTNIHVIIGRNGVGKTHLVNGMISSLINGDGSPSKYGLFSSPLSNSQSEIFANLVSVSFSAFDETELIKERRNKLEGIMYSYIGLRSESTKAEGVITTKSPVKLKREYARSVYLCKIGGKIARLKEAIKSLESDPIFDDAELDSFFEIQDQKEFETAAADKFNRLSSGHKIVLLTITRLVETVEERSLVLIDEPEAHLHPPLLSAFVRALSNLLVKRNAVAIITTHSPVVLQEVPRSCCWNMRRTGASATVERLEIESFGENVGSLTQEVFDLEVTESGFHKLLRKMANSGVTYPEVLAELNGQLGFEAKAILRSLIGNTNSQ